LSDSPAPDRLSTRRKQVLVAAILLVELTVLILAAEGAVRVRQLVKYGSAAMQEDHWVDDPKTQLRIPVAGFSSGRVSINSLGFRGPEIAVPKPPGTVRIAFLGASTTCAATFPAMSTRGRTSSPRRCDRLFPPRGSTTSMPASPGIPCRPCSAT
jgi:hypothetical protein